MLMVKGSKSGRDLQISSLDMVIAFVPRYQYALW